MSANGGDGSAAPAPFAAALLLVALITPVLGMSLDGRFAERIPGHGHVGTVEVDHVHDFTRSHVSGGLGTHQEMGERAPAESGPVLVEYAPDVLAGGVTLTPAPAPLSPPALAPPPLLPLLVGGLVHDRPVAAPPTPPPRPLR